MPYPSAMVVVSKVQEAGDQVLCTVALASDAAVGRYNLTASIAQRGVTYRRTVSLVVLFHPYLPADAAHVSARSAQKEYVESEVILIWQVIKIQL